MPPIYEFSCVCKQELEERLCSYSEKDMQECDQCQNIMIPVASATYGKVVGSRNPVKQ